MNKLIGSMLLAASLNFAAPAMAATESYGDLLAGTYQPASTFATLSVTGSGSIYNFTLSALDLNSLFTSGAFIGAIAVDLPGTKPSITNVSGGSPVAAANGGGPTGIYDYRFDLTGPKQARLTANESVSWTATFASPVTITGTEFALHVQGLSTAQGGSAWYTVSVPAVPEPDTYALMIAGLGLMGFVARRHAS